jgi:hypothetical protein
MVRYQTALKQNKLADHKIIFDTKSVAPSRFSSRDILPGSSSNGTAC